MSFKSENEVNKTKPSMEFVRNYYISRLEKRMNAEVLVVNVVNAISVATKEIESSVSNYMNTRIWCLGGHRSM